MLEIITSPMKLPASTAATPPSMPRRRLGERLSVRTAEISSSTMPARKTPASPAAPPRIKATSNAVVKL
jgi:hypothetical protein